MSAHTTCILFEVSSEDGAAVGLRQRIANGITDETMRVDGVAGSRIFLSEAFRAGQFIEAAVRTWRGRAVLDEHALAQFGADHRHRVVTIGYVCSIASYIFQISW